MRARPSVSTIPSRPAALGGLDRLAIDHGSTRRGLAPDPLPVSHDEQVVHSLKQAGVAPPCEPAIHGGPGRTLAEGAAKRPRPAACRRLHSRSLVRATPMADHARMALA